MYAKIENNFWKNKIRQEAKEKTIKKKALTARTQREPFLFFYCFILLLNFRKLCLLRSNRS